MNTFGQMGLDIDRDSEPSLPTGYVPRAPAGSEIERIILTRGSLATAERQEFVHRICAVYRGISVEERLHVPHNKVDLGEPEPLERLLRGKRTLVFGALNPKNAVWSNPAPGGMYPYRRFFSIYGLCPYRCAYCYLNATPSSAFAPSIKIHVNLPEILTEIDRQASAVGEPLIFYSGKMHDSLALDPLTAYSTVLIPFFAAHPLARLVMQTKSADVEHLLALNHRGHTALSWTLTPAAIAARFEPASAPTVERLAAMERCVAKGYPVCANIAPILQVADWEEHYFELVRNLVNRIPVRRIFFGGMYLKQLSWRFFGHQLAGERPPWFVPTSSHAYSYAPGYADRFFERVVALLAGSHEIRCEFGSLNGGSLVVRFGQGRCFDIFSECADEKMAMGHGAYAGQVIHTTRTYASKHDSKKPSPQDERDMS